MNINLSKSRTIFVWALQTLVAVILLQTLYFKFTGSLESTYIFSKLGIEPGGRILVGIAELIAAALLLIPWRPVIGACLSLGIIFPALFFHLTSLGIVVMNDGGLLFVLALIVLIASITIIILRRKEIPFL